ncbi:SH3 domain-containing protein [Mucilaginibacter flavus]|uniref:SH3 domain-containing protein n=1 Tax=Mucilaginibacter flavus TaxID=931504 RepID=UPI0025B41DA2|nr:SH3 domain-containing protein [Mucilaginibacter flavus]MDN3579455.1 SH3 domain-containing protein [Mucilaginibacter flavus]
MKKRLLSLPVLFFLLVFNLVVKAHTAPATKLNVWLLQGVQLKASPSEKSKTIATLPYGTSVNTIKETSPQKSFTVDFKSDAFKKPYKLKGQWVKVDFNGKTGYVFDGFLSALPPLHKDVHGNFEPQEDYLKRNYGVKKIEKISNRKAGPLTTTYYNNGIKSVEMGMEGCFDHQLYFTKITLNEAVLLQKVLYVGADAAQNIKVERLDNNNIKISSYDCD